MTTLHITAPVTDIDAFKTGFAEKADVRRESGVRDVKLRQSVNGDSVVVIDLDFGTVAEAEAFLGYVRENIWKDNPLLAGSPKAMILEPLS